MVMLRKVRSTSLTTEHETEGAHAHDNHDLGVMLGLKGISMYTNELGDQIPGFGSRRGAREHK